MLLKLRGDRDFLLRCCGLILCCTGLFASVLNVISAINLAAMPYEMNYEEGNILNSAVRITQGLSPYPDPHSFPNVLSPYGPISYCLTAGVVRLFGINLFFPRLTIILSTLVCATLVGLLLYRYSRSWPLSIAFGCLFLTSQLVYLWMPLLRVDLIGLAFALLGLFLFAREGKWQLWSIAFFLAALFVKYSLLAGPAACCAHLLFEKKWKHAMRFTGLLLAGALAGSGVAQWLTSGYFAFHMFGTHPDPFFWPIVTGYMWAMMQFDFPLTALAAVYLIIMVVRRTPTLPALYLIFATLACVTIGKLGSDSNHLLEFHAACTLCAGLGLADLAERVTSRWVSVAAITVATLLLAFYGLKNPRVLDERGMARDCGKVYEFVQHAGNRILSENVGLLVLTGKPVYISNPFVYRHLILKGWSDRPLQERIRANDFDAIVLSADPWSYPVDRSLRWSPEVLTQIKQNYRPIGQFQCTEANMLLVPREVPHKDASRPNATSAN